VVNRPSIPEIITVNSETLQTQIRDLLPSQNGFGSELQATNVITPVIDLTAAAEGSGLGTDLQTALAFGSQTVFSVSNATSTIVSGTGFFRVTGSALTNFGYTPPTIAQISLTDGISSKQIYDFAITSTSSSQHQYAPFDFIVFLAAGESVTAQTDETGIEIRGSHRQIATGDGTLVNPSGYPL
jgi:hypothetical protein